MDLEMKEPTVLGVERRMALGVVQERNVGAGSFPNNGLSAIDAGLNRSIVPLCPSVGVADRDQQVSVSSLRDPLSIWFPKAFA